MNEIKRVVNGLIKNEYEEDDENTYSTDYINKNIKSSFKNLYNGSATSGSITLNNSIQNYDFILIGIQASEFSKSSMLIPVSDIVVGSGTSDTYEIAIMQSSTVYVSMQLKFTANTTLEILSTHQQSWADAILKYVIGIKL